MADDTSSSTPSNDHAALLERRLKRERAAREQAEALLVEKMESLYETLKQSQNAQKDLELALWASQESFWSFGKRNAIGWRYAHFRFILRVYQHGLVR